jgi:hypothetical protein
MLGALLAWLNLAVREAAKLAIGRDNNVDSGSRLYHFSGLADGHLAILWELTHALEFVIPEFV